MSQWKWFVYILECSDGLFYTGMTWNLTTRIEQHKSGKGSKFTAQHGFKRLLYYEEYKDINEARARERQVKNWSREKKLKLIKGEFV